MSSFALKLVACITMFVDHLGLALFDNNRLMRIIGRIAMPIFAFQVGVGFKHTHSKPKYILRMLLCGIVSEIPFLLLLSSANFIPTLIPENISHFSLNICFTFTIALLALFFIEKGKETPVFYIVSIFVALLSIMIPMDYGIFAVLIVILSYFCKDKKWLMVPGMVAIAVAYLLIRKSTLQMYMLFALPFILLYNGKKGKSLKYYFYVFYPLHMLLIALIKIYLLK